MFYGRQYHTKYHTAEGQKITTVTLLGVEQITLYTATPLDVGYTQTQVMGQGRLKVISSSSSLDMLAYQITLSCCLYSTVYF